jgi:hypothetical protein
MFLRTSNVVLGVAGQLPLSMFVVRRFSVDANWLNVLIRATAGWYERKSEPTTPDFGHRHPVKVDGFGKVADLYAGHG